MSFLKTGCSKQHFESTLSFLHVSYTIYSEISFTKCCPSPPLKEKKSDPQNSLWQFMATSLIINLSLLPCWWTEGDGKGETGVEGGKEGKTIVGSKIKADGRGKKKEKVMVDTNSHLYLPLLLYLISSDFPFLLSLTRFPSLHYFLLSFTYIIPWLAPVFASIPVSLIYHFQHSPIPSLLFSLPFLVPCSLPLSLSLSLVRRGPQVTPGDCGGGRVIRY